MKYPLLFAAAFICPWAATLGQAAQPRPNILIAIADDWSFGHAGAYDCQWVNTPSFDRVAREGVLFNRFYTPNAKCSPSRAAILTGRNPWQLGPAANHTPVFPPQFQSFPEALGSHGYFVGMTMKGWGPGEAKDKDGVPRQMTGIAFNKRTTQPPTSEMSKNDYASNFEDFLTAAPKDKPWCFWYGSIEPHRAYEFGSGIEKGGKKLIDIDRVPSFWPDTETVRNDMLDYAYEVEYFDKHLGRMLSALEARGELDQTLVIVMADNGMPFPRCKGQNYEMANHLPLAIRWPMGIPVSSRIVDDYVSVIDLAPTILEAAQVSINDTAMAAPTGKSILPLLKSDRSGVLDPTRDHVLLGRERNDVGRPNDEGYPVRSIIKNGLFYSRNFEPSRWPGCNPEAGYLDCDSSPTKTLILHAHRKNLSDPYWALAFGKRGDEELYDLNRDPDCIENMASLAQWKSLKESLENQMKSELLSQEDPRILGRGAEFDAYPYADPKQRGFYDRHQSGQAPVKNFNSDDFERGPIEPAVRRE